MKFMYFLPALILWPAFSCRTGKKEEEKKYVAVRSLIEEQVKHVESSFYSIVQVVTVDSLAPDTSYIHRDQFRQAASEFLSIPDLSHPKTARLYNEEPARYDEMLGRVIITYTAKDPEKAEYPGMELMVTPNPASGDKVNNIMVTRTISSRDSFVHKKLLWQMDKSYLVTALVQKPGEPEKTVTTRVSWNEGLQ